MTQAIFDPTLGQIWASPAFGLHFLMTFLTQRLGLSILTQNWVKTTQHFCENTGSLGV